MKTLRLLVASLVVFAVVPPLRAADKDVEALAAVIDAKIAAAWEKDTQPAPAANDAEFFRRLHLDLTGRIPSVTEVRDFLDDDRPDKRRLWVERILLGDPDDSSYKTACVNHFTNVWRAWLLAQTDQATQFRQPALEAWLRQRLKDNVGYDRLVRDLLTQSLGGQNPGSTEASAAAFYQANEFKLENLAGNTARLFLGVTIECAQCHNHPFDKRWKRSQFWEYAAFFTDVTPQGRAGARGEIKIPGQDKPVRARFLDGKEPRWKEGTGTRPTLADWMTAADNPYFARAAVNRLWSYFFGISLADTSDREAPAAHRELLNELSRQFVAHKYDVKFLIRAITVSRTYQRTSAVSQPSQEDARLLARMPLRGLSPEQLFDSIAVATEYQDGALGAARAARNEFLARFPAQQERTSYQISILQALYMMNNPFIAERTSVENNRTLATLAEQRTSTARKIESLYLVVLSRKPTPEERARLVKYVDKGDPKKALSDVFWVLLNSSEFILNH